MRRACGGQHTAYTLLAGPPPRLCLWRDACAAATMCAWMCVHRHAWMRMPQEVADSAEVVRGRGRWQTPETKRYYHLQGGGGRCERFFKEHLLLARSPTTLVRPSERQDETKAHRRTCSDFRDSLLIDVSHLSSKVATQSSTTRAARRRSRDAPCLASAGAQAMFGVIKNGRW